MERRTFEAVVDAVCAPEPPLPPVHETDAAEAFDRWMATAPVANRAGARAALMVYAAIGFARWERERRARWTPEPLRAAAGLSYYGDHEVLRCTTPA